ncbi:GntR family transcriptional regulator [Streptomyces rapamycinicus]|uniref:GntR family transcriptional regulator n=2 Tax=Streptomyces rapamycinicus TaxID=1226757 RepID=A0A0A0NJG6_STRRN|nr:GntR family transcriptional regulator [Streptomyces rapamycinicus]AGP56248.1 GntR family transcriptional regulator [Streptomyces rapamycinicus NRRL 5491]MBB4783845.1 DNA-binding GntR family transcriptional regulator [Streptomyces rapamycinicus]RLV80666.1 GntR family transcriptional regulator [Streptomyces rapamycinicus NRRL 5491]UTO64217.1 GntR family transcriptional regulator [Streptomyces rapamycinicus]UTP32172.1 GntR family transcriptional regulator [Streptomyces rapamycinicus NRRL 5491]
MPVPGTSPVKRNTLRQQIADALCDEVLAGRLPAGRQFTVKEIAQQYGVSATPVREALLDLCSQGLLDVEEHRGFKVHEFTIEDFRHMVDARTMVVEGVFRHYVEQTLNSMTPQVMASVRRRAEEAERAARSGDLDILIGYDLRFWREICGLVGNPYVLDFLQRLRVQTWVFTVPYLRRVPDLRGLLWTGHCELTAAVTRGDPHDSERLIAAYNTHFRALIERLVTGEETRSRNRTATEPEVNSP